MVCLQKLIFSLLLETYSNWHKVIGHIFQIQRCPNCLVKSGINTKPLQKRVRGREISKQLVWGAIQNKKPRGQREILSISLRAPALFCMGVLGQPPLMLEAAAAGKHLGELTSWHQPLALNTAKWPVKETVWNTTLVVVGTEETGGDSWQDCKAWQTSEFPS